MYKYKGKHCQYELSTDVKNKIFHAQASGFFMLEDGKSFLNAYDEITKKLSSKEYTLIIDIPDLEPSLPDVAELLFILLEKYISVPFKARFLLTCGSVVTISQFKMLGSKITGWDESVQYVKDLEEALKIE
jgi:hypothetical protein